MPDDENINSTDNSDSSDTDNSDNSDSSNSTGGGGTVGIAADTNNSEDQTYLDTVIQKLEGAGYQVENLGIGPNKFASWSYSENSKGKKGVMLLAVGLTSICDLTYGNTSPDFTVFGVRGGLNGIDNMEEFKTKAVHADKHGDCYPAECCNKFDGMNYPQINEEIKDKKAVATFGASPEEMATNVLAALGGQTTEGGGITSGGTAQVKDTTFERCVRRICAATDSIFIVEGNAAVLFPYTDWMAFTLRQKINTIEANDIDPDTFTMEYTNDGFYNKVTIAWGGATLPERFVENAQGVMEKVDRATNYTLSNIYDNMVATNFNYAAWQKAKEVAADAVDAIDSANQRVSDSVDGNTGVVGEAIDNVIDKAKTTLTISQGDDGGLLLSEQYDSLVDIYGELEKRVESAAPDYETAQYIVNALLIQYVRDFNNSCKCRALTNRKYIGGTFYAVQNPWTKESELFYLNGYTIRTQDDEPMYHDLDFKYGPEGAEEITDYQALSGGGGGTTSGASEDSSEDAIWAHAAKFCHQWSCPELREAESDTNDPQEAEDYIKEKEAANTEKICLSCYGMSAWLYYQFNNKTSIKCQVVGDSTHKVVMVDRGEGMVETREEYQQLDTGFRWRTSQNTTVLLAAPNSSGSSTSGGNTNSSNTNSGNSDDNSGDA